MTTEVSVHPQSAPVVDRIQAFRQATLRIETQHQAFLQVAPRVGTTAWSRPATLADYMLLTYDSRNAHLGLLPTLPAPIALALWQAFQDCMR